MSAAAAFQHVLHTRRVAVSVSDGLARALRIRGEFPPLIGELTCEVVRQTVPVAREFEPPLTLTSLRNASGFLIIDGTYRRKTPAGGAALPLGAGTYIVRVGGQYYQDADFTLDWPPPEGQSRVPTTPPTHLELLPGPMYPLPDVTASRFNLGPTVVRGTIVTASGAPIERAIVEITNLTPFLAPPELPPLTLAEWPFARALTSASGDFALVLPGRRYLDNAPEIPAPNAPPVTKNITISITPPAQPAIVLNRTVTLGTEFSLRATALRGQVVGSAGQPIAGAQIATSVDARTSVSRANGLWFLYFHFDQVTVNPVTVTVTTPAGATASDASVELRHDATVVVPTFHFS